MEDITCATCGLPIKPGQSWTSQQDGSNPEHIECLPHEVRDDMAKWGAKDNAEWIDRVISSVAVPHHAGDL